MRTQAANSNAENATPDELKMAMEAAPNKRSYVRLAAIRALLMGLSRELVCQTFAHTDRMVGWWIECFNRAGIDGLITRPKPGRPRQVKLERVKDLLVPVLKDPATAGPVHWTGGKLHGYLKVQLATELDYRTTLRYLHELNYNLLVPRSWPERQNPVKREEFQAQLRELQADPQVQLWFSDECGVEGDPRLRRRWVPPGQRRTVPYLGDHIRQNVIGAVAPQTGQLFSLVVDGVDGGVFQFFLDQLAQSVPKKEGMRQILILDNASWHKATHLQWHHFEPKFLPAYSPDSNPIERLWLRLKADWFWDFVARSLEELTNRLCTALKSFIDDSPKTASICDLRK